MPFFTLRNTFFGFVAINLILVFLYNRSAPSFPEKESISLISQENISTPEVPQVPKQDEVIARYEKQIASLKQQLEQAKDATLKHKEAKDQLRNFTLGLKKDYELLFSRYKAHSVTLNYTKNILTDISPFAKLDIYSNKMPLKYYNFKDNGRLINGAIYSGAKHNPFYCVAVDLYNFYNPENIFKNMNFMTDYSFDESLIRREVMTKIGNDVMPDLSMRHSDPRKPKYDLAVNATMTFFKKAMIHSAYEIHKEMACVSQMYNHIPGSGVIARKDLLVEAINKYTDKYLDRPQCLHGSYFPQSYRLNDKQECKKFFSEINSKQFHLNKKVDPIQFLLKLGNGPHRAMGLSLLDEGLENQLRVKYQNGLRCGEETKSFVAQQYISNPLVLDKDNKFDFRIYMLVASVDPLIVYYHDGFLRVSLSKYDKHSKQKNVHFTNTHLSKKIFQEVGENDFYDGMDEDELRDYQMWSMEELQEYLLETHQITDKNWLDNYLRPKFKEAFIHLARMAEDSLYKSSSVFEMYGLDFVMDKDTNLWFIECNPSPQLVGTTQKKTDFIIKLITDLFEIQYAYLRSRMKRVYGLIKNIQDREYMGQNINYSELRGQFDILNMNKLEPEFSISKTNSFSLILDKNLDGAKAYFGHLSKECID